MMIKNKFQQFFVTGYQSPELKKEQASRHFFLLFKNNLLVLNGSKIKIVSLGAFLENGCRCKILGTYFSY